MILIEIMLLNCFYLVDSGLATQFFLGQGVFEEQKLMVKN